MDASSPAFTIGLDPGGNSMAIVVHSESWQDSVLIDFTFWLFWCRRRLCHHLSRYGSMAGVPSGTTLDARGGVQSLENAHDTSRQLVNEQIERFLVDRRI